MVTVSYLFQSSEVVFSYDSFIILFVPNHNHWKVYNVINYFPFPLHNYALVNVTDVTEMRSSLSW